MNITVLSFDKWNEIYQLSKYGFNQDYIDKTYNDYVKMINEKNEHVAKTGGYPNCHCDHCIEAIEEYKGFKKYDEYFYKGHKVYISSFCPLEHCADIFVSEKGTGFCDWLTIESAKNELVTEMSL